MPTIPTSAAPPEAPASLAERAFHTLRDRLVFLDIPPGAPLNESQLSAELGVGRTPLREAIKRLETEQLVVTYPRRGTFATPVDITALTEITQVREVLEPLASRLAADRRGGEERSSLIDMAGTLATLKPGELDRDTPLRIDSEVHALIARASGNAHLAITTGRYGHLATRIWCVVADRLGDLQEHVDIHEELLRSVLDGEADRAYDLMWQHVVDFEAEIRRVL